MAAIVRTTSTRHAGRFVGRGVFRTKGVEITPYSALRILDLTRRREGSKFWGHGEGGGSPRKEFLRGPQLFEAGVEIRFS